MNNNQENTSAAPPQSLVSALKKLLRPLVKLLLLNRISYIYFIEIIKSIYVDVAESEFPIEGKKQTDSRITLLTGVHRKDVRRLRREEKETPSTPKTVSLGSQLVAHWLSQENYTDCKGKPLPLFRLSSQGEPSFETLVESVGKQDIRPRSVLDEWLQIGVAHIDESDKVNLNVDAFVPEKGFDEKAYYFGQNIRDHIAATVHNLSSQQSMFFERSVHYFGLSPESITVLKQYTAELGNETLKKVNRKALDLKKSDAEKNFANMRINFGIYHFSENTDDEKLDLKS